jgi:hypothetical protein
VGTFESVSFSPCHAIIFTLLDWLRSKFYDYRININASRIFEIGYCVPSRYGISPIYPDENSGKRRHLCMISEFPFQCFTSVYPLTPRGNVAISWNKVLDIQTKDQLDLKGFLLLHASFLSACPLSVRQSEVFSTSHEFLKVS